jgi:hypothetical protein
MTDRHTPAEDDILVRRRNHTKTKSSMWRTCHCPPIAAAAAQGRRDGADPRERERERDALARWRSVGKEFAKENAHTAQCATSMDIRKRKQPFLYIFLTYLPSFLPSYLPTYLPTYLPLYYYLTSTLLLHTTYLPTYDGHNHFFSFFSFVFVFIFFQ